MPQGSPRPQATAPVRRPPQVLMIRKDDPQPAADAPSVPGALKPPVQPSAAPVQEPVSPGPDEDTLFAEEGLTMADLLGPEPSRRASA
ncbi:MAG: hypothetical protein WBN89_07265, partial [Prochlorococcaceae cyanobacterium]